MLGCDPRIMLAVIAIAAVLFGVVQSRAVNISNTWMLPEEGFPVFYRYFRDRISWYEADAVCQFHHANLVTADSSSQYDAIRAYLKELDITEKVWIGLSKPQEKPNFIWTDFHTLTGEGHWHESLPAGDSQSLCAVMDPTSDFLWRALPCGGPDVAAFICELPIPSWAQGPRGCMLTELPSLTVLYIPEQSALELTSDCGLDGTKRIACKGNADREEMLHQLTCVISNPEDMDTDNEKMKTSTSDYLETSTWDGGDNSIPEEDKSTKAWTLDDGMATRHRRETEDTLSPISTKSSFKEVKDWQDVHQDKAVLTTQNIPTDQNIAPTAATSLVGKTLTDGSTIHSTSMATPNQKSGGQLNEITGTLHNILTTQSPISSSTPSKLAENSSEILNSSETPTTKNVNIKTPTLESSTTAAPSPQEGNIEDYPSAINQGQLFSIIDNGTMYDIIELNETYQDQQPTKTKEPRPNTATVTNKPNLLTTESTTKKPITKKPIYPTKKVSKKDQVVKHLTTERPPSVDEIDEKLTKEFEMMPDIRDTSVHLNRTFRKEVPPMNDEHTDLESGGQFGVPRIINFTVSNALEPEDEELQRDEPFKELINATTESSKKDTITPSVVKKNNPKLDADDDLTLPNIHNISKLNPMMANHEDISKKNNEEIATFLPPIQKPIDPRLFILNNHPDVPKNNNSESIAEENPKVAKEDFLPKSLLGEKPETTSDAEVSSITTSHPDDFSHHPFPSDEPKKVNRHRSLHNIKGRKFYPYFFSRMLG